MKMPQHGFGCLPRRSRPLRVAFDCPGALPLFDPTAGSRVGGAEVRSVTFARQLQTYGDIAVQFVVAGGHPLRELIQDGIRVTTEPSARDSVLTKSSAKQVRQLTNRLAARWSASVSQRLAGRPGRRPFFENLMADVVCCFGVNNRTASVVRSLRRKRVPVVVFLTSDRTLDDLQRRGRKDRGAYGELGCLCRYALRHADAIVVQKQTQLQTLQRLLNRDARLIRNPIDLKPIATADTDLADRLPQSPFVLWVGRADTFSKRADQAIELARRCPEISFVMLMNCHDAATFRLLTGAAPPNVTVVEQVPFTDVELLFQRATLLLNTSDSEGFPNALLQAGKYGVPTVSLRVDPDYVFERYHTGLCARGDLRVAASALQSLIHRNGAYQQMSRSVRRYVHQYHDLTDRSEDLRQCLEAICQHPRRLGWQRSA